MSQSYIVLENATASVSYKFKVLLDGYAVILDKAQTVKRTIGGGLDVVMGSVYEIHRYNIKVPDSVVDVEYGSHSDLEDFYRMNQISGSSSHVLTLTDHLGVTHQVVMSGQFVPQPLVSWLEGTCAWYIIPCEFQVIPEEEESI